VNLREAEESKRTSSKKQKSKSKKQNRKMADVAPALPASLRDGCAIDATNKTALLEDVLETNGEDHLFSTIMELSVHVEEDPPVIFGWQNVEGFVQAIQQAQAQAAAPGGKPLPADPFGLPAAVNVQNFKEAVLEFARIPGALPRLDTTCLPCSLAQSLQVTFVLGQLDLDPWIRRVAAVAVPDMLPIAFVYVPRPRSHTLDRVTEPRPGSLWG